MKRALSILLITVVRFSSAQDFQPIHQKNLGLITYLVHVKMVAENVIVPQFALLDSINVADSAKAPGANKEKMNGMRTQIKKTIKEYVCLKITYDEIVLQLMADLKMRNRIGLYRRINRKIRNYSDSAFFTHHYKMKKHLERYRYAFAEADKAFVTFSTMHIKLHGHGFAFTGFADVSITDAAGFVWGMIKDIHDMNKDKVDGICDMLDSIRLSDVSDLQDQGSNVKSGGDSSGGDSKGSSKKSKTKK